MFIDFLLAKFAEKRDDDAVVWRDRVHSYGDLLGHYARAGEVLDEHRVPRHSVVALESDFSPLSIAFLLALIERGCVIVPLTSTVGEKKEEFLRIAETEVRVEVDAEGNNRVEATGVVPEHPLILGLKGEGRPGLVLFSSGSTGKSKAVLHDFVPLLEKFKVPRHAKRMLSFLLFDHIGGLNTLFYCLANGGTLVTVSDRSVGTVLSAIEKYKVQILPTSPTFLNLILVSERWREHDLSSLELITYGTEPMQPSTLRRIHELFPRVRLQQTYGLSELGILRSKSEADDSPWMKIGGEGYELRVRNGLLEIKAQSAMLGYLNAPSPFTDDGWFQTGDRVDVRGDYCRILGRDSEIINVGGEKVYPAEIESELLELDGVEEAVVTGEPHPITGQIVKAVVRLTRQEPLSGFRARMHKALRERGLPPHKIPQKVSIAEGSLHSERFKVMRR